MSKYLFLTDIDGTLLRGDSGIGPDVISAAKEFTDAGGLLGLSTGRAVSSSEWVADAIGVNAPSIVLGGAAVYDFGTRSFLKIIEFGSDIIGKLEHIISDFPDVSLQAYSTSTIYILNANNILLERGIREELTGVWTTPSKIEEKIVKLVLSCDDICRLINCRDSLLPNEKYNFSFSSTHFAEVSPLGADKGNAMLHLSGLYDISVENIFAAGDGLTDVPMLKLAGHPFVPKDAPDAVKSCGQLIPSCEEGGMEQAFSCACSLIKNLQKAY